MVGTSLMERDATVVDKGLFVASPPLASVTVRLKEVISLVPTGLRFSVGRKLSPWMAVVASAGVPVKEKLIGLFIVNPEEPTEMAPLAASSCRTLIVTCWVPKRSTSAKEKPV